MFNKLIAADVSIRADAARILGGFALGVLSPDFTDNDGIGERLRAGVYGFVTRQITGLGDSKSVAGPLLLQLVEHAVKEDTDALHGVGSRWATSVACSIVILSGRGLFHGRQTCEFVLKVAKRLTKLTSPLRHDLSACLWKCLVWAFSQHPRQDLFSPASLVSKQAKSSLLKRSDMLNIVKQELKYGVGASLVATLLYAPLGPPSSSALRSDLNRALSVLQDMVICPREDVYQDALAILGRMLHAIGSSSSAATSILQSWRPSDIPAKVIFSRHSLTVDGAAFSAAMHKARRLDVSAIPPLSEEDVQEHWNTLLHIWTICLRAELENAEYTCLPVRRLYHEASYSIPNVHFRIPLSKSGRLCFFHKRS